jgi:hypothetical protein
MFAAAVTLALLPVAAAASGIINGSLDAEQYTWPLLLSTFGSLVKVLVAIASVLAAAFFMYGGWLYLTSGGDSGKIEKAHGIFKNVGWGFALLLAAWLVVVTLLQSLGAQDWLLQFFGQK